MSLQAKKRQFEQLPGIPIAFWVSASLAEDFEKGKPISDYVDSFQGIITGDNDKFLRFWTEVNKSKIAFGYKNIESVNLDCTYWIPIIRVESLESGMVFRIMLFTGEMGQMIKQGAKKHSVIIICENMQHGRTRYPILLLLDIILADFYGMLEDQA